MSKLSISHFRVPPALCIETRLSAQPLIRRWFFILMQIKLIFTRKVAAWPHFESEGFWNLAVAYCLWHWCHKQYRGCGSARVGGSGVNELTRQEFSRTSHPLRHLGGVTCFRSRWGEWKWVTLELTTTMLILQFTHTPTLYSSGLTCLFFCICTNAGM